jgi:hypothetical protein
MAVTVGKRCDNCNRLTEKQFIKEYNLHDSFLCEKCEIKVKKSVYILEK